MTADFENCDFQNFKKFTENFSNLLRTIWIPQYHYQLDYLYQGNIDRFNKEAGHPCHGVYHVIEDSVNQLEGKLTDNDKHYINLIYGI